MNLPAQFINWKPTWNATKGKWDKHPWCYVLGHAIDPHNPIHWKSHAAIVATGHPVAFVITDTDPFFFFDLDGCVTDGAWSPESVSIFQALAGAAAEVSYSGTGMHIIGTCNKAVLADRRNKWDGWKEFYIQKRFVAFGPGGWQGDFHKDCTEALLRLVPQREALAPLPDGVDLTYTGPVDDDELIAKMLASGGSLAQMMGSKATIKDLWNADAANLSQIFPSPTGDTYDRSSADASLMAHLAFWTGRDAPRMDRLFRRSGLMRPKFDTRRGESTYGLDTITRAVAACRKVYDHVKAPDEPTDPVGEVLTPSEQIDYFRGCVYVRDIHRVMDPLGDLLKPEQFKAYYGGRKFVMTSEPTKQGDLSSNAFDAFTENRAVKFPKVRSTCFKPGAAPGAIMADNRVNVYFPETVPSVPGSVEPFMDLLRRVLPDDRDRDVLINYMAAMTQMIGVKFQWAPVIQGAEGNGKSFILRAMREAMSPKYTHSPSAEDLGSPFNSYIENKLFIAVEEVHLQGRRDLLDTLKPLITQEYLEVQAKGIDKRMTDNYANWMFCTNHRDAVLVTEDSRRYAMLFTAQQKAEDIIKHGMGGEFFPNLWNWARSGGFKHITHHLQTLAISDEFKHSLMTRAPVTSATADAIVASKGRAEQEIMEAVEAEQVGFRQGWISTYAVGILLKELRIKPSPQKIQAMIESLGYKKVGRVAKPLTSEGGTRPTIYVLRGKWEGTLTTTDYCQAQGYAADLPAPVVVGMGRG